MTPPDAVEQHVTELERALRGPARLKRSMLAETRDGLRDAERHGGPEQAVREFGPVTEIAPLYQAELVAAQARRTGVLLAPLFPALLLGWDLLWSTGLAWPSTAPAPAEVRMLATNPFTGAAFAVSLVLVVVVLTSAMRALRAALHDSAGMKTDTSCQG